MSKAGLKDYLIPFAVVGMLGVMIIPLPYWLLDILLSFNLAFAVLFLISSIFLLEPQRFTSLPTLLLLSTVFRLSLNISTTRSVLAGGEIPQIVIAFGDFVVGGNMVVGAVVFAIITVVQFLVIAKGAERVAEVAARFTLDAMPGKQMAIDADLRAGAITLAEARILRRDLQTESKLFGSLDGAMKFVKGDAIAGILITTVNLVAGVFIGCVQQNLSFQQALKKFGIFTIGDGLVSQMPALVVAAAAGIAITRVADQEQPLLGRAIIAQLASDPKVLYTATVVLALLAITPGMPALPFLISAIVLILAATAANQGKTEEIKKLNIQNTQGILLAFSQEALTEFHKETGLMAKLSELRQMHYQRWGVIIPDFEFKLNSELSGKKVIVEFSDLEVSTIEFISSKALVPQLLEKLSDLLTELNPTFINDRQTRMLLEQNYLEDTVNSIIPEMISITSITKILRTLVDEQVSIKQLGLIIQEVAEYFAEGIFTKAGALNSSQIEGLLVTAARKSLAAQISSELLKDRKTIEVYKVAESLDQKLSRYAISTEVLPGDLVGQILNKIAEISKEKRIIFICSRFSRSILANIIKQNQRKDLVLGSDELSANFTVIGELAIDPKIIPLKKAA